MRFLHKPQEWCQGELQGYSQKEIKEAIKKELTSLSISGHEVHDPVLSGFFLRNIKLRP